MTGDALPTEHNWWKAGNVLRKDRAEWARGLTFSDSGGGKSLLTTGPTPKVPHKTSSPLPKVKRLSTTPSFSSPVHGQDVEISEGTAPALLDVSAAANATEFLSALPSLTLFEMGLLGMYLRTIRKGKP